MLGEFFEIGKLSRRAALDSWVRNRRRLYSQRRNRVNVLPRLVARLSLANNPNDLEFLRRGLGRRECFVDHTEKFRDIEGLGEIGAGAC